MNSLKVIMFVFSLFLVGSAFGEGKKFKIGGEAFELTEGKMLVIVNRVDRVDTLASGPITGGRALCRFT